MFPTHDDEACVWLCAPDDALRPLLQAGSGKTAVLLDYDRGRRAAARGAAAGGRDHRAGTWGGEPAEPDPPATGPGWALVGDAGYHRDPITGHGISDAFRDAEFLAWAIDAHLTHQVPWSVAGRGYDRARTTALHDIFAITQALPSSPSRPFIALQKQLSDAIEREALAPRRPTEYSPAVPVA